MFYVKVVFGERFQYSPDSASSPLAFSEEAHRHRSLVGYNSLHPKFPGV